MSKEASKQIKIISKHVISKDAKKGKIKDARKLLNLSQEK